MSSAPNSMSSSASNAMRLALVNSSAIPPRLSTGLLYLGFLPCHVPDQPPFKAFTAVGPDTKMTGAPQRQQRLIGVHRMGSFVLQQRNALKCCTRCRSSQGLTFVFCQCWRQFKSPSSKSLLLLYGEFDEHSSRCGFRDLTFYHEFFKRTEIPGLAAPCSCQSRQNRHSDGFFVGGRHTMPFTKYLMS